MFVKAFCAVMFFCGFLKVMFLLHLNVVLSIHGLIN